MPTQFFKAITQPMAGMTLFALINASWSSLAVAHLPTLPTIDPQQLQPALVNNRWQQFQPAIPVNHSTQLQTTNILGGGDRTQNLTLCDGDTLFIPTATTINLSQTRQFVTASFATAPNRGQTEAVVGNRKRPGSYLLLGSAKIRLSLKGRISRENVSVDFAQGANSGNNPIIGNNDIVVVSRSNTARVADAVNLFLSPGAGIITLFSILGIR
ncbi:hypothetical protein [Allocoleopsis franciscana]|uniref:Uncharacterized protein n=1 Tax=Allocoleopsis franciscana PCC 7113 TaxID=1173027 RepID=K9WQI5_9CYAN|nr:hypothetical protein [Allocoleopsis franciscana]AFZ21822.1 hypothetical protein Mic7113_6232 [Allocoleopsis franciscana PCC 7113]